MRYCPRCKNQVQDDAKFCDSCGLKLDFSPVQQIQDAPVAEPVTAPQPEPQFVPEQQPVTAPQPEPQFVAEQQPVTPPQPEPQFVPEQQPAQAPMSEVTYVPGPGGSFVPQNDNLARMQQTQQYGGNAVTPDGFRHTAKKKNTGLKIAVAIVAVVLVAVIAVLAIFLLKPDKNGSDNKSKGNGTDIVVDIDRMQELMEDEAESRVEKSIFGALFD